VHVRLLVCVRGCGAVSCAVSCAKNCAVQKNAVSCAVFCAKECPVQCSVQKSVLCKTKGAVSCAKECHVHKKSEGMYEHLCTHLGALSKMKGSFQIRYDVLLPSPNGNRFPCPSLIARLCSTRMNLSLDLCILCIASKTRPDIII
jgi:hypothetical protein